MRGKAAWFSGKASLDGILNVSLLPGYQPNVGDTFAVLNFASSVGGFAVANGMGLSNGDVLAMQYDATDLTLATTLLTPVLLAS